MDLFISRYLQAWLLSHAAIGCQPAVALLPLHGSSELAEASEYELARSNHR